jgi:hypothetical protein
MHMRMTHEEQQCFALLWYWIGNNPHEVGVLRGDDLFQAMYTGVRATAEASGIPDDLVRRTIRGAIDDAQQAPDADEDEDD